MAQTRRGTNCSCFGFESRMELLRQLSKFMKTAFEKGRRVASERKSRRKVEKVARGKLMPCFRLGRGGRGDGWRLGTSRWLDRNSASS